MTDTPPTDTPQQRRGPTREGLISRGRDDASHLDGFLQEWQRLPSTDDRTHIVPTLAMGIDYIRTIAEMLEDGRLVMAEPIDGPG